MKTVEVQKAKTHSSVLLAKVEQGVIIDITRGHQTVVCLVPIRGEQGLNFGEYQLSNTLFDELLEEELSAWEGA